MTAAQAQLALQPGAPGQLAGQAGLALPATAPAAAELQAFPGNPRVHLQRLDRHGQLTAGQLALAELHAAIDLRRQQAAGQVASAVEPPRQMLDHRQERPRQRQIQTAQTEIAG
ncbi:hypothetical protein D3C80_1698540 [compost metagenome]